MRFHRADLGGERTRRRGDAWHVDDLAATVERLLASGATEYQPITEHGPGFVTASVVDPFGVLGVMFNQHYLDMLG